MLGSVGDFRATVNPVSKLDRYPIPRIEDLFATLNKGKLFTKPYSGLPAAVAARGAIKEISGPQYKGLFRCTRLPYGISSAPGIFQHVMDNLPQGFPGVVGYLDDILISGEPESAHLEALEEVLKRLSKSGLRAKKCKFMVTSVDIWATVSMQKGYTLYQIKSKQLKKHPLLHV